MNSFPWWVKLFCKDFSSNVGVVLFIMLIYYYTQLLTPIVKRD